MLKISEESRNRKGLTLRVEGRIVGPWVEELRMAHQALTQAGKQITLILEEVSFCDRDGVELLKMLAAGGVLLDRCRPFLQEQLKDGEDD